ncbi:MAG: hypothetical protein KGK08_03475 [Acidobacteriota bacterium]|nr:hypothetical protein [Acidobacteriota bacterium]
MQRKDKWLAGVVVVCGLAGAVASGQTHKVAAPEKVVRAVGVYEWVGDMTRPTASRLVPVTVFLDDQLQDAGVFLARPIPFALENGNVYELQQSGLAKGTLELRFARHLVAEDTGAGSPFDDGWFGYGVVHPPAAARHRASTTLRPLKNQPVVQSSGHGSGDDRPHLVNRSGAAQPAGADSTAGGKSSGTSADSGNGGHATSDTTSAPDTSAPDTSAPDTPAKTPAGDPERPTLQRRSASGASSASKGTSTTDASSAPADDPDRPVMKRRSAPADADPTAGVPDDPDRPTIKRRSASTAPAAEAEPGAVDSLNADPDRPSLHRGRPAGSTAGEDPATAMPRLTGMPKEVELHQMVAVSDAANREPHNFAYTWQDDQERKAILARIEALAQKKLAAYLQATHPQSAQPQTKGARPSAAHSATRTAARKQAAVPAPPAITFADEDLRAFQLSYGASPTYVFTAHTAGAGSSLDYVTEVAQAESDGELRPAIESVTDAAHLDRTPRLRLIDAVDVDASNRASLLFELREQNARQFALYRVLDSQAEQIFATGTTP